MIAHTIIVAMKLIQVGFLYVFICSIGALLQTGSDTVDPEVYMNTVSFFFQVHFTVYAIRVSVHCTTPPQNIHVV